MPRRAETVLTVIVLILLPTVMYGGYSLLGLQGEGVLSEFQNTYFRAGHAHAGVLLVMTLAALNAAGRFGLPDVLIWPSGTLLIVGALAQSGGMFLHMGIGEPGEWSPGNTVTSIGAVFLAAGLIVLIYGVIVRHRERVRIQ
jgi:heme/copper-type cytochrome/quinol oxidase subunit 1